MYKWIRMLRLWIGHGGLQNVFPRLAASASSGNLLKMYILGFQPTPTRLQTLGVA